YVLHPLWFQKGAPKMDFLKRLCVYICIILLCISVYKDITEGTFPDQQNETEQTEATYQKSTSIIKVKVQPGDTVLSITEEINNPSDNHLDIQQILADFKHYNPNIDPNHLQVN